MKRLFILLAVCSLSSAVWGQEVGLSFSYFLPRNGYFSTPISPFSFRGVGVSLNRFLALETGGSLYRMSGLNVIGSPLESREPLVGPNFTLFVPVELVLELKAKNVSVDLKAGGFVFHGFAQKLNYGNIDKAIRQLEGWDVANADFSFLNRPGYGYHFGIELTIPVAKQYGVSLECNYLIGSSALPLKGTYAGGTLGGTNQTRTVDYDEAKVDFSGLEFSIGVFMQSRRR